MPANVVRFLCVHEVVKPTADMAAIFGHMVNNPIIVQATFRHVLGLGPGGQFPWHRVGQPPSAAEMMGMSGNADNGPCTCDIDPRVVCGVHPCKCVKCADGAGALGTLDDLLVGCRDSMTCIQVLEAYGGQGPTSGRERNLLNITAGLLSPCRLLSVFVLELMWCWNMVIHQTGVHALPGTYTDAVSM